MNIKRTKQTFFTFFKQNMETIGERIDYLRKDLHLTYNDLGEIIGTTGNAIRVSIKRNKIRKLYINTIIHKLNVNSDWLLNNSGEIYIEKPNSLHKVKKYLESSNSNFNTVMEGLDLDYKKRNPYLEELVLTQRKLIDVLEEKIKILESKTL